MVLVRAALALILLGLLPPLAVADPAVREDFEGSDPCWRDAGGDGNYKIVQQQRAFVGAHGGRGCERIRVTGDNGSFVYVSYELGEARIIGELTASVWINADRPGLQILLRVVLPHSLDSRTGRPLTTLLRGSGYTQAGNWQQLRIDNLPRLLERQVRALRAEHGPQVDEREAYVDRVLLNIYGGPGTTNVSIDDLEVTGIVGRAPAENSAGAGRSRTADAPGERLPSITAVAQARSTAPEASVRISGAGLVVGDKPLFPRLVEHRGEPLEQLKRLGFNGVRLSAMPTAELLREAAASGMWLVAPPPSSREIESRLAAGPAGKLDGAFDPILAWDLGEELSSGQLEATKNWSRLVRTVDPRRRPLVCDADSDLLAYSRSVDLLMTHRSPLGASLDIGQYTTWLRERPQLARPGTPTWTTIQTQPSAALLEQIAWLSGGTKVGFQWQDEQIRLVTFAALASGVRGICFQSKSPLNVADPATRRRAALLELVNLELDLIEPWCASGSFVTTARGTDPDSSAAVMQTDRARLVLPLATAPASQFALRLPSGTVARYVVPGVPESNDAYELLPGVMRPLAHKRVAGGISVVLPEGEQGSLVVLTQDSSVIANLTRRAARAGRRAAELKLELASLHLARIDEVAPLLAAKGQSTPQVTALVESARAGVKQAEARLAKGNQADAYLQARRSDQLLYQVERQCWEKTATVIGPTHSRNAAGGTASKSAILGGTASSGDSATGSAAIAQAWNVPLGVAYELLPEYWRFMGRQNPSTRGANLLASGEFEDLQAMLEVGWRHYQHPLATVTTDVQLAADKFHGGRLALRLQIKPAKPDQPPTLVETAPLWVTTPAMPLEAGSIVCIHGWVNMPQAPQGSVDGLLIVDSLGGETLAERIGQTGGWREVTLLRAAPRAGNLVVTFALTGLGEAWLDDFTVQTVPLSATDVQQVQQPAQPARSLSRR